MNIDGVKSRRIVRIVPMCPMGADRLLSADAAPSESTRITGKQRAVRIFGLSVVPEMRLTVSFRITYTLRPVWGAGAVS